MYKEPVPRHREALTNFQPFYELSAVGSKSSYVLPLKRYERTGFELKKTIDDVKVDQYKKRSALGEVFFNPLTLVSDVIDDQPLNYGTVSNRVKQSTYPYTVNYQDRTIMSTIFGSMPYIQYGPLGALKYLGYSTEELASISASAEWAQEVARSQAFGKVSMSEASAYVTMGEFRESMEFITGTISSLVKMIRKLKKLDFRYFQGLITREQLESQYLAFRYGLRPMISEVQGFVDASWRQLYFNRQTARSAHVNVECREYSKYVSYPLLGTNVGLYGDFLVSVVHNLECQAGVLFQFDISDVDNQFFKYGFEEPLEAILDLVPLSFILNWFFNIQELLASWTPNWGLTPLGDWTTTLNTTTVNITPIGSHLNPDPNHSFFNGKPILEGRLNSTFETASFTRTIKQRAVYQPRPFVPHCRVNLNLFKTLDLFLIGKNLSASLFLKGHRPITTKSKTLKKR